MASTMFARTRAAPSRLGSLSAPARAHRGVRAAAATANGAGAAGTKLDALIIGGGPAGLSTALMLKQRGCEQADVETQGAGGEPFQSHELLSHANVADTCAVTTHAPPRARIVSSIATALHPLM